LIFTTRSRRGLGIGLLVSGLLLLASGDNHWMLVVLGVLVIVLGYIQIVRAYRVRDSEDQPEDPFASPTDGPSEAES
jgi:hypothetical protein